MQDVGMRFNAVLRKGRRAGPLAKDLKQGSKDMLEATWKPHMKDGQPTVQSGLPDSVFEFPKQRKDQKL